MRLAVEAYLDGEVSRAAGAEVAEHLSICWECSSAAETLRLMKRALSLRRAHMPSSLAERRLRAFAERLASQRRPDGASAG